MEKRILFTNGKINVVQIMIHYGLYSVISQYIEPCLDYWGDIEWI
jgi:hypothetical protein